jgi:hypothetical protein
MRLMLHAAVLLAWASVPAWATIEYQFILVDAFTPDYSLRECYIWDINSTGTACGTATIQIGSSITYTGFYWTRADEKTPVGISWPKGISDADVMAGVQQVYDIPTGQLTNVPLLPSTYPPLALYGMNAAGVAVGYVQTCNCLNSQGYLQVPYVWDAVEGARSLPVPGANGAARINNNGIVVGWIGGWVMTDGYVYDLNTDQYFLASSLFGGSNIQTTAVDVSENNVVVGARKEQNGQVTYGYTWSAAEGVTLLPLPPAGYQPHLRPAGINSAGVVVGAIYTPNASSRACVYDSAHGVRDLNTLTTPSAGFTLMAATAISDQGWIVGYGNGGGGMYKSFVLIPYLDGDLNCDGAVDFGDINPFVLALTNPAAYASAYPSCNILNADINADGSVDFGDINPFVALLASS